MEPRPAHLIPRYTPPAAPPKRLGYRPREIARLTGLHPSTIYNAIAKGELNATRLSERVLMVPVEALEAWLGSET